MFKEIKIYRRFILVFELTNKNLRKKNSQKII